MSTPRTIVGQKLDPWASLLAVNDASQYKIGMILLITDKLTGKKHEYQVQEILDQKTLRVRREGAKGKAPMRGNAPFKDIE